MAFEAVLVLLGRICSIVLEPANRASPLPHMTAWSDGTTSLDPDHRQLQIFLMSYSMIYFKVMQ